MASFTFKTGDRAPSLSAILADANGAVIDLTGATVAFALQQVGGPVQFAKPAVVVTPATGMVRYDWAPGDTAVAGQYRAQWVVTTVAGKQESYPADAYIEIEILASLPVAPPSGFSGLADFYDPVRAFLGDFSTPPQYSDDAVRQVLRGLVLCGRFPGYALDATRTLLNPGVKSPRDFGLLTYLAVSAVVVPASHGSSFRTRALSMRKEGKGNMIWELDQILFELRNPQQFASWQSFGAWMRGVTGLNPWREMAEMKIYAPVASVSLSVAGIQVSGPGSI